MNLGVTVDRMSTKLPTLWFSERLHIMWIFQFGPHLEMVFYTRYAMRFGMNGGKDEQPLQLSQM